MKKYLYLINYSVNERELALLEKEMLFKNISEKSSEIILNDEKIFISEIDINPSDSPFIKGRLELICEDADFNGIINSIEMNPIEKELFKVEFMKLEKDSIPYSERLEKVKEIGLRIIGTPSMYQPSVLYGIAFYKDKWYFGIYEKNNFLWQNHIDKPKSYSNSVDVKIAKGVLNIATCGAKNLKIMDTCAGVGTIVLEGLFMGLDIRGYEINDIIAQDANYNLNHYGYSPIIKKDDMHNIKESYDITILDIPYGIFSHITEKEQEKLIEKCYNISDRMILISFEELDHMVKKSGFKITGSCSVPKGKFKRNIYICQK